MTEKEIYADGVEVAYQTGRQDVIDRVLEIIDDNWNRYLQMAKEGQQPTAKMLKDTIHYEVLALKGEQG